MTLAKTATPILAAKDSDGALLVYITGMIGESEYPWGEATGRVDLKLIRKTVEPTGTPTALRIMLNSLGGDAYEGLAIGNYLKTLGVKTTCAVIGVCCSAANYIALSCDVIEMPSNAQWMLHEARTWTLDDLDVATLDKLRRQIVATNESCVATYVGRTKQTAEKIRELMAAETWVLGNEALELGFCDVVTDATPAEQMKQRAPAPVELDALKKFKHAPANILSLVANPAASEATMQTDTTNTPNPANAPADGTTPLAPAGQTPPANVVETATAGVSHTAPTTTSTATPAELAAPAAVVNAADINALRDRHIAFLAMAVAAKEPNDERYNSVIDRLALAAVTSTTTTTDELATFIKTAATQRNAPPAPATGMPGGVLPPAPLNAADAEMATFEAEYASAVQLLGPAMKKITLDQFIVTRRNDRTSSVAN